MPFPTLERATATQIEFTYTNITGTLVGFRLPAYLGTTNQTGYHLHFVSDDHTAGGHVLDVAPAAGLQIESDLLGELFLEVAAPDAGADGGGETDSGTDGGGDAGADGASDAGADATTDGGGGDATTDAESTDGS
ncbi:Alpha-acetolactate decarboxylase [Labilithrix luteola]|uniref:Alpha-acetolactate decarboxylase n=2 Tax=Labilithrix luteola TaxID=1391654 RepID=A0A0K1PX05_9BACT|nr:Alpha-acetolactate decarboxylase [Labilithrix luteola]